MTRREWATNTAEKRAIDEQQSNFLTFDQHVTRRAAPRQHLSCNCYNRSPDLQAQRCGPTWLLVAWEGSAGNVQNPGICEREPGSGRLRGQANIKQLANLRRYPGAAPFSFFKHKTGPHMPCRIQIEVVDPRYGHFNQAEVIESGRRVETFDMRRCMSFSGRRNRRRGRDRRAIDDQRSRSARVPDPSRFRRRFDDSRNAMQTYLNSTIEITADERYPRVAPQFGHLRRPHVGMKHDGTLLARRASQHNRPHGGCAVQRDRRGLQHCEGRAFLVGVSARVQACPNRVDDLIHIGSVRDHARYRHRRGCFAP